MRLGSGNRVSKLYVEAETTTLLGHVVACSFAFLCCAVLMKNVIGSAYPHLECWFPVLQDRGMQDLVAYTVNLIGLASGCLFALSAAVWLRALPDQVEP